MKYHVPEEHLVRLHHARPRFKRDVENVLIFMVREICHIGEMETKAFEHELERAIYRYPGNVNLALKTVKNWRTEIDALFGLIVHEGGFSRPSALAVRLAENLDLISFFRVFLTKFQYPGGHLKSNKAAEMVRAGVKFKPASFVIRVLLEGQNQLSSGRFWLTKAEATHHIWNDIRVTSGLTSANEVAKKIIHTRSNGTEYDNSGDVVRYAGDILDYMVLGNIIDFHPNGRYFLIPGAMAAANLILSNASTFKPYDHLYNLQNITSRNLSDLESQWFVYAGDQIDDLAIDTDPLSVLEELATQDEDSTQSRLGQELLQYLRANLYSGNSIKTKDIGNTGESLVLRHEFNRLKQLGLESLGRKVRKITYNLGIGYDLKSWLDSEQVDKLIEVKTSISKGALRDNRFHLTKNEWNAANSSGSNYYVYRILISSKSVRCFVIHNPIEKYKQSLVNMSVSDGADLSFTEDSGHWEQLLI